MAFDQNHKSENERDKFLEDDDDHVAVRITLEI